MNENLTYEKVCQYIGGLFLRHQQEIDRLTTVYQMRITDLESTLNSLQEKIILLERAASYDQSGTQPSDK